MTYYVRSFLVFLSLFLASGCAATPGTSDVADDTKTLELRPEWKSFVLLNYRDVVKNNLKAPATAQFEHDPGIYVSFNPAKNLSTLSAVGFVDAQNSFGALLRTSYAIFWTQPGDATKANASWRQEFCMITR